MARGKTQKAVRNIHRERYAKYRQNVIRGNARNILTRRRRANQDRFRRRALAMEIERVATAAASPHISSPPRRKKTTMKNYFAKVAPSNRQTRSKTRSKLAEEAHEEEARIKPEEEENAIAAAAREKAEIALEKEVQKLAKKERNAEATLARQKTIAKKQQAALHNPTYRLTAATNREYVGPEIQEIVPPSVLKMFREKKNKH
jgi:hypothetical protein